MKKMTESLRRKSARMLGAGLLLSLVVLPLFSALAEDGPAVALAEGRVAATAIDPVVACAIGRWLDCDIKEAIARGLFETGLEPRFPENADCPEIDEGYAISYTRKRDREQYHGGIDLPAARGTPVVAAAAGTVVALFNPPSSYRGIEVMLRHSPADTGIDLWIYTQYTHCAEMPPLVPGQRLRMGETVCLTGNSGYTRPGKRGERRPAVHFGAFYSAGPNYAETRERIIPQDGFWMDPVALYRKAPPLDSATMKALPAADRKVPVPVLFEDGGTSIPGTKRIWPYTCSRR